MFCDVAHRLARALNPSALPPNGRYPERDRPTLTPENAGTIPSYATLRDPWED